MPYNNNQIVITLNSLDATQTLGSFIKTGVLKTLNQLIANLANRFYIAKNFSPILYQQQQKNNYTKVEYKTVQHSLLLWRSPPVPVRTGAGDEVKINGLFCISLWYKFGFLNRIKLYKWTTGL